MNIWGFEMTGLPVKKVSSLSAVVKQSGEKRELQLPSAQVSKDDGSALHNGLQISY